jgi:hypothetical protein
MHDARSLPLLDRLANRLGRGIAVDRALAEGLVRQQTGLPFGRQNRKGRRHRGVDARRIGLLLLGRSGCSAKG